MAIASIHSSFQLLTPFTERLLSSLTSRQKTIAAIAVAIFASIALAAFVYRLFIPKSIHIATQDQIQNRIPLPFVQSNSQTTLENPTIQIGEQPPSLDMSRKYQTIGPSGLPVTTCYDKNGDLIYDQTIGPSGLPVTIYYDENGDPIYDQTRLDFAGIELTTERLLDYAAINYKNTTCVEDARIILMGEAHIHLKHQDLEVAIINQFGNDGDVFLLEGLEYGKQFIPDPNTNYGIYGGISKNIHMNGWEDDLKNLGVELLKECKVKRLEITAARKQLERGIASDMKKLEKISDEVLQLTNQFMQHVHERNNSLIRSIKRALIEHPRSKIFVFAGRLHILEVGAFDLLDHMPENEKCAALIFKE